MELPLTLGLALTIINTLKHMKADLQEVIKKLKFDQNGLIPAIAQDAKTGEVLMMAFMNLESLELTVESGFATYYSRSRKSLWKKGDTSGHLQEVVSISTDCDFDCILMKVRQVGVACHTGEMSCFFNEMVVFAEK